MDFNSPSDKENHRKKIRQLFALDELREFFKRETARLRGENRRDALKNPVRRRQVKVSIVLVRLAAIG